MWLRALGKIRIGVGMGSVEVGAVFSRRSRAEIGWGDGTDLVGQCSAFYSVTSTREDFAPPPAPRDRCLAVSGEFWSSQLGVGVLLASSGQRPGLLLLTSCNAQDSLS